MSRWNSLSEVDKIEYKKIFDEYIGDCFSRAEDGEPLYFTEDGNMYQTDDLVNFLLNTIENKN